MNVKKWDEPYKNKKVLGEDILIGVAKDGSLIYLPADKGEPSRNVAVFYGSNSQKKSFLITRTFVSILSGRNIVVLSSDIKNDIYDFAREQDYVIKELNFDDLNSQSNHWELLGLINKDDGMNSVQNFTQRIIKANKLIPSKNQVNAFNYINAVLLYICFCSNEKLKKVSHYIINYDDFEKEILKLNSTNNVKQFYEFAKNANNYFKWDIPTISNIIHPFFSKSVMNILNSGSMSLEEFKNDKCIYVINPSVIYSWLPPFILSYILDLDLDCDVFIDQGDFCIPDFKNAIKKGDKKIYMLSHNMQDVQLNYPDILSGFGTKISFHGCDINAAKYLSEISGINAGNNKLDEIWAPQEIVSCGQDKELLFVLSAKRYLYKTINLSYLNDVIKASL